VQRLAEEGYLNVKETPQVPQGYSSVLGPGGEAASAAQQVQFNLTEKGMDFLGYKTLKNLLGSIGKSSLGAHETPHLATGVEAEAALVRRDRVDARLFPLDDSLWGGSLHPRQEGGARPHPSDSDPVPG
jgi:hypothetical protein